MSLKSLAGRELHVTILHGIWWPHWLSVIIFSLPTCGCSFIWSLVNSPFVVTGWICAGARTHWSHYQHCVRRQNNPQEPHHKKTSYAKGKNIARSWIKWRAFDLFDSLVINFQWSVINNITWALLTAKNLEVSRHSAIWFVHVVWLS